MLAINMSYTCIMLRCCQVHIVNMTRCQHGCLATRQLSAKNVYRSISSTVNNIKIEHEALGSEHAGADVVLVMGFVGRSGTTCKYQPCHVNPALLTKHQRCTLDLTSTLQYAVLFYFTFVVATGLFQLITMHVTVKARKVCGTLS